jgi:hypothetical protein
MLHETVWPPARLNNGPTERWCAIWKILLPGIVRQPGKAFHKITGWKNCRLALDPDYQL